MDGLLRFTAGEGDRAHAALSQLREEEAPTAPRPAPGRIEKFLAEEDNFLLMVFASDTPIGYLVAYRFHRVDRDATAVYLYDIWVRPEHRRRGVAAAMVRRLRELTDAPDLCEIWVGSGEANRAACALWESLGARRVQEPYVEFRFGDDA